MVPGAEAVRQSAYLHGSWLNPTRIAVRVPLGGCPLLTPAVQHPHQGLDAVVMGVKGPNRSKPITTTTPGCPVVGDAKNPRKLH
ncbi:MAG TPA: hypothetical protein VHU85_10080 [Acidimicrobiales bacterium]|nr:hypothetical protein [Acidimicrobiales bacterium]